MPDPASSPHRSALPAPPPRPDRRLGVAIVTVIVACFAVYANSLRGDFVYDDVKQILGNHLIQDDDLIGRALVSDVWAFKGESDEAWSNYWRPTFVAWLMLGVRLFGLSSTVGWHVGNIALHALASVLALLLLRRLGLSTRAAFAATLLFAVHPVHVESVAWISGSPDLLLAVFGFGALLAFETRRRGLALVLYALALGAKEVAIVLPAILAVSSLGQARERDGLPPGQALGVALRAAAPFAFLGGLYLVLRHMVIGQVQVETPWRLSLLELITNGPPLMAFYLRQALWPATLAPSYPLRALETGAIDLPLLVGTTAMVLGAGAIGLAYARRDWRIAWGGALFVLVLVPAFNLSAFLPEQLVHDRYLYVPILGLVTALVLAFSRTLPTRIGRRWPVGAVLLATSTLLLGWTTLRYNPVWQTELALWQRAVEVDPRGSYSWAHLGLALRQDGRDAEAMQAFERALAIEPVTAALLGRAELALANGQLARAAVDLERVVDAQPDNARAHELLALTWGRSGRVADAARLLDDARRRITRRRCSLTTNLAVLRYLSGDRNGARALLEEADGLAPREPSAGCQRAAFHLGSLYREQGDLPGAIEADRRFLARTESFDDAETTRLRKIARRRSPNGD